MDNNFSSFTLTKNSSKPSKICNVRKMLSDLAFEEARTTPEFKVTYISNTRVKLVKYSQTSLLSTDDESLD